MDDLFTRILNRLKGAKKIAEKLEKTSPNRWASTNLKIGTEVCIEIVTEEVDNFKSTDKYEAMSQIEHYLRDRGFQVNRKSELNSSSPRVLAEIWKLMMMPQSSTDTNLVNRNDVIDEFVAECESDTMAKTFGLRICDIHRIADKLKNKEGDSDE